MAYGFVAGVVNQPGFTFEHLGEDIEALNKLAGEGRVDVSAASVHAFAYLSDKYAILKYGASFGGEEYGPRLVGKSGRKFDPKIPSTIAIPGERTSAALALKLFLASNGAKATYKAMPFDQVQGAVLRGEADFGVLIHEGQLSHYRQGLEMSVDLGAWWFETRKLPLPLGIVIIKRALSEEGKRAAATAIRDSIEYALANREAALKYALTNDRGLTWDEVNSYVDMYVNHWTRDIGEAGAEAITAFLKEGVAAGIIPHMPVLEFVGA